MTDSSMDVDQEIEFDEGWAIVEEAAIAPLLRILDEGLTRNSSRLFNHVVYMQAYTVAYKLCTQRKPKNFSADLYQKHADTIRAYLASRVLPALRAKQGNALLLEFVNKWDLFLLLNKWMSKFFTYLVRFSVCVRLFVPFFVCEERMAKLSN